ncbi:2-hydroxymuconate tautomerase [Streptomyces sp. CMB-StM0423]|uniref:2-hydroxymuconate tautomerase n=1 Tax=Streptomyces sp. CMB-StM0423 TaxID=2059884 RepID=UPI001F219000|nr:2-hydroxymuconate tautomerase [Streptomyces sp. CMB-StM0423]
MPLVEVTLVEGRSPSQLRALIGEVTRAVARTADAPPEAVRVIVREVPASHWAAGDVTIQEQQEKQQQKGEDHGPHSAHR